MTERSFIYRDLRIYRAAMSLLYGGQYKDRFRKITDLIPKQATSVFELCFGDLEIAKYCRQNDVSWTGVDINPEFCRAAHREGFPAQCADLFGIDFDHADLYIIAGSLYHFHQRTGILFEKIFSHTNTLIVSEPIVNWSNRADVLGKFARRLANPGTGHASFRYDRDHFFQELEELCKLMHLTLTTADIRRDAIVLLEKSTSPS